MELDEDMEIMRKKDEEEEIFRKFKYYKINGKKEEDIEKEI